MDTNIQEQFKSQMIFLGTYADEYNKRKILIDDYKSRLKILQPHVDEYTQVKESIRELEKQNQSDEKLLISMNNMVLRASGQPVSNGPLFDEKEVRDVEEGN